MSQQSGPPGRPGLYRARHAALAGCGLLAIAAIGAALLAPILTYPFGRDQGVFAAAADIIERGGVPYRDIWDVKPPGIFYLYQASFAIFGRSVLAPRIVDLIWTLATAVCLWSVGRRLLSPGAAAAGALFFLLRYVTGNSFWNTAQPDGFASLPLVLAVAALVGAEQRRSNLLALICGASIALAVLLKPTLGIVLMLPVLALVADRQEGPLPRLLRFASYLLGCLLVLAFVAALLWRAGALKDTLEVLFLWNAEYSRLRVSLPLASSPLYQTALFLIGGRHHWLLFPVGLLALVGAADLAFRPNAGRIRWLLPTWALVIMASVWLQGKYYTYHWLPVLPPLALLAGHGLAATGRLLHRACPRPAARALSALGLAAVLALLGAAYWKSLRLPISTLLGRTPRSALLARWDRYGDVSLSADRDVAAYLGSHTEPADTVFVWGFEPLIYFLADRAPASRFLYTVPLVTAWSPTEWRAEFVRDLEEKRTPFIVVAHNDVLPWMTGRRDDSAAHVQSFGEFQGLLDRRYRKVQRIEDFDIYERRDRQSDR
ncbi:MAG TPA: glycosyltransferase family 39 protein [Armatimonadota bacterium]|nr:glycosyltransferase family 39 protein [Armatimonadota bacterium]